MAIHFWPMAAPGRDTHNLLEKDSVIRFRLAESPERCLDRELPCTRVNPRLGRRQSGAP